MARLRSCLAQAQAELVVLEDAIAKTRCEASAARTRMTEAAEVAAGYEAADLEVASLQQVL